MKSVFILIICLIATFAVGCAHYEIRPITNDSQVVLDAEQTVQVLLQAGLSDKDILRHGGRIRDTLAQTGAVQIRNGRYTEAILAAHPPYIYLTSRHKGSMIFPITGQDDAATSASLRPIRAQDEAATSASMLPVETAP